MVSLPNFFSAWYFCHPQRHPDGVGSVAFKEHISAEACITQLNGRWYGGKQLEAFKWDGVTNYQVVLDEQQPVCTSLNLLNWLQVEETEKERQLRLKKWEEFISSNDRTGQVWIISHLP